MSTRRPAPSPGIERETWMAGMLTWTPALATGFSEIDSDHEELFRRADAFLDGLAAASPADAGPMLAFLRDRAAAHFEREEAWMRSTGYPDLEAHHAEHARFGAQLVAWAEREASVSADALATWLVRWLYDHVVRADLAAAEFVRARDPGRGRP